MAEVREHPDALTYAEKTSERDRYREYVFPDLEDWVTKEVPDKMSGALRGKDDFQKAQVESDLARALYLFSIDPIESKNYEDMLLEALYSEDGPMLKAAKRDGLSSSEVLGKVDAAISNLTLVDLIEQSRPEFTKNITSLDRVVTTGRVDVVDKVDLDLDLGIRTGGGKKVIHQIQLKSSSQEYAQIKRIDDDDPRDTLGVESKKTEKIIGRARRLEKNAAMMGEDIEVRSFVVIVPKARTKVINNVYGKVNTQSYEGRQMVRDFHEDAVREGFFPKRK